MDLSGCSSGVEHNLAKVGVEGSNPFARSKLPKDRFCSETALPQAAEVSTYYSALTAFTMFNQRVRHKITGALGTYGRNERF